MAEILMDLALIITTIITGIIIFYKWRFQYWKKRKVPSDKATIPFGSLKNPIVEPESYGHLYERLYKQYKAEYCKHVGLFTFAMPIYMPIDLEIIKHILIKDFDHFVDRGVYYNEKDDPLSAHLFAIEGAKWRNLRAKLTPTFTSGKLKSMFPLVIQHAAQLKEAIHETCLSGLKIDAKLMLGNFTTDVIGSSAFGLDCNSFKNPNAEYRKLARRLFQFTRLEAAKVLIFLNNRKLGQFLKYKVTPPEVEDFFMKTITETVNYRETTKTKRNDFIQTLIELKNNPDRNIKITMEELAAQAFIFFAAAVETSSSTFGFCMYEMALNTDVQEKVREEVKLILKKYGDQLTYENLSEMKYLQQVVDETLRKYPSVPLLNRVCLENYKIPGIDFILEKGTNVVIPVIGIHHDEDFYPDHQKFDPERFNEVNKAKLATCCYMPFGEGPRTCIGLRFGVMQVKVGIATLVRSFRFSLTKEMPKSLEMNPYSFVLSTTDDIMFNVEKMD